MRRDPEDWQIVAGIESHRRAFDRSPTQSQLGDFLSEQIAKDLGEPVRIDRVRLRDQLSTLVACNLIRPFRKGETDSYALTARGARFFGISETYCVLPPAPNRRNGCEVCHGQHGYYGACAGRA